jgi:HK97 family phage portal protein
MSLMDSIRAWFSMTSGFDPPMQTRAVPDASVAGFIARIQGARDQVWRIASTDEALGVPAIFSSVTLISNAMGSMSLRAFRDGREVPDTERPRIIIRPNPFSIPRDFYRDTAYSMAVYGEAWWWVAARDFDDLPLSLIPVNPREIIVNENPDDLRFPIIEWRGKTMPNKDMKQITYLRDPGGLRGFGPLQKCGAAVSVAVEAQEWAANFYADGGIPSIGIKTAYPIGGDKDLTDDEAESEADKLRNQWIGKPHNTPRVYGPDIDSIEEFGGNEEGAQMLTARSYNAVEAAQMFNIPAPMIEAAVAGASLTYQNIPDLYDSFARRCLSPNYAEPIEQTMSDLLTRQVVGRFNMEALLRVDLKTRWEVYGLASKVIGVDEAASMAKRKEGLEPGDVEFAPVPQAVPAAVPSSLPIQGRADGIRCASCGKLVARALGPGSSLVCPRCKAVVAA